MNTNPYAPPHSAVGDVARDEELSRFRSRVAIVIAANAAVFGALVLLGVVVQFNRRDAQGALLAALVFFGLYGVLSIVAAIGLYRQQRWAAIQWLVQSALVLLVPLFAARFVKTAEFVLVGIIVVQFIGSMVGVWAVALGRGIKAPIQ